MIPRNILEEVLAAGITAPSGSNSQPWKFRIKDNYVDVIALPEKDHKILNFKNRGTLVAHGALLENIAIAAKHFGYDVKIEIFPDKDNTKLWARLFFKEANSFSIDLFQYIAPRTTNRKPYSISMPSNDQKAKLESCSSALGNEDIRVSWIYDKKSIEKLAEASSSNEIIMLENKKLHSLFFNEIAWTRNQEKKRGGGLYVKTMELGHMEEWMLRFFLKHWSVMRLLNFFGFARMIASDNAKIYASAGMWGCIVVRDKDEDFLSMGRIMERIWLEATALGLSFHLITGILFLHQRVQGGSTQEFSVKHINLIESSYEEISNIIGVPSGSIVGLLFRVGISTEEPTARSYKPFPKIDYN